jgi:hypothetical protein
MTRKHAWDGGKHDARANADTFKSFLVTLMCESSSAAVHSVAWSSSVAMADVHAVSHSLTLPSPISTPARRSRMPDTPHDDCTSVNDCTTCDCAGGQQL